MKKLVLAILLTMASYICFATDILISDVPETDAFQIDCEISSSEATTTTYFFDDGGNGSYLASQTYMRDIQSTNGSIISVKFVNFNLANGTLLTIRDAVTREVLVSNATGTSLNGRTITSHHGALRFIWISGAARGQGFKAKVWCGSPCQQFTTNITVDIEPTSTETGLYYDVCKNAPVTFTANNVFLNNNQEYNQSDDNLTYNWTIITINDTLRLNNAGQTISHSFAESGGYYVMCDAIDSRGCANREANTIRVRVSIAPTWENISFTPDSICSGTEVTFTGAPHVEPWREETPNIVAGPTALPDASYICYTTYIFFNFFPPLAVINSVEDIDRIYINMEHSYLGDLSIMITCPNGQNCLLHAFDNSSRPTIATGWTPSPINNADSRGGGSIHLGLAPDPASNSDCYYAAGIGYEYNFTPTATTPFGPNGPTTRTTYTDPCGNTETNLVLDPGDYATYESLSSLIGCPLGGMWSLQVCDHLSLDNGWVMEWGIYFDESLIPEEIWDYSQIYGDYHFQDGYGWWFLSTGPDNNNPDYVPTGSDMYDMATTKSSHSRDNDDNSSFSATTRPQNPDPDNPALIPYTFSVTDNFGCTYDTTVTVYVLPASDPSCCITPVPELSVSDTMPCTNSVTLTASDFDLLGNTGEWTYRGPGTATFGDINQPQTEVSVNVYGDYTFTWHEYYMGNHVCSGEASVTVNFAPETDATLASINDRCRSGELIELSASDYGTFTCSPSTSAFNAEAHTFVPALAEPGVYTITNDLGDARCAIASLSSQTFTIYDEITVSNRAEICTSSENGTVEIRFDVNGLSDPDDPPAYSITGGYSSNGSATINVDETRNQPQYSLSVQGPIEYSLLVSDEHGCSNINMQGNYECDCPNYAGTFVDYNAKIMCTGEAYWLQRGHTENHGHNGNQVDTARNAVFSYIVCTNPNDIHTSFVTELPGTTEAIYLSTINGQNNRQYYLVAVVGFGSGLNAWGNGCRSVSQPVPLMWRESPHPSVTAADTCGLVMRLHGSQPPEGTYGYWTATAPEGVDNYSYTTIANTTNNSPDAIVLVNAPGAATFTWNIVNAECTGRASAIYDFRRVPTPEAGPDITVCGVQAEITGAYATIPALVNSSLQWSCAGATILNGNTIQPQVNANSGGTYLVTLTERNGECAGRDNMRITFVNIPAPATTANVDTVCGHVGELQVYNANPSNEGRWTAYYDTISWTPLPTVSYSDYNNPTGPNSDRYPHCFVTVPIPDDQSEVEYVFKWTEPISDPRLPDDADCQGEAIKRMVFRKVPVVSVHQCESTGNSVAVCGNSVELCAETVASEGYTDFSWVCKGIAGHFSDSLNSTTTFTLDSTVQINSFQDVDFFFVGRNGSCMSIDTMHVRFLQKPVANAGLDHVACGNSYELNGVWGLQPSDVYTPSCQWTVGEMPNPDAQVVWANTPHDSIVEGVQVSDYGIYTFIVREMNTAGDATTCFDRDTVTIEFMERPNVFAGEDFDVCGLDFQLNATSSHSEGDNISGLWTSMSGGEMAFADRTDPNTTGHYSSYGTATFRWVETNHPHITTENEETCSAFDDVEVTFFEQPSPVISMNEGDTIACGLSFESLRAENPGDGISGFWYEVSPATQFGIVDNIVTNVAVSSYGKHDFYWIEYTGSADNPRFCKDTAGPWTIDFIQEPIAQIRDTSRTFCSYSGMLCADFNGVGEGRWSTDANSYVLTFEDRTSPCTSVYTTVLNSGNSQDPYYNIYWTVRNTEYCTDKDTIKVIFAGVPSDSIKVIPPKCFGEAAILTAYEDSLAIYDWDFGNGYIDSVQTNVAAGEYRAFVHWDDRTTSHIVGLTATNSWGCTSNIGRAIVEEPEFPVYNYNIINDTCALGKGGIEFIDTAENFAFYWIDTTAGPTITDPNGYAITDLRIYNLPAGRYVYRSEYQTSNTEYIEVYRQYFDTAQCSDFPEFEVGTIGMLEAEIAISAEVVGNLVAPDANAIFYNTTNYDNLSNHVCEWHFGDDAVERKCDSVVEHIYIDPGCYEVYLVVMNREIPECRDTAMLDNCVFVDKESKLEVPNIFSPNGDGINDYFQVTGQSIKTETFHGIIMNRYGQVLFEWSDWENEESGWDGKIKGSTTATPGVYYYIIEAEGMDKTLYNMEGAFHLVR